MTFGDDDGYSAGRPLSPAATKIDLPAAGRKYESYAVSPPNSLVPQLFEMYRAVDVTFAYCSAAIRLGNVALFASTNRILAPGASACAHCTSRSISIAQPASAAGSGEVCPVWFTFLKQPFAVVHCASPNCVENLARSASALGASYASTSAIV